MTPHSLQNLGSSLQTLPVMLLFSKQLLLPQESSATVKPAAANANTESLTIRATQMTTILKNIPGYIHGGLNE